ncbi:O-antigen ligase family protein [Alteromonas sp. 1_MG-2023]|uniref:O-antigen ligase family protein n=1 Tax=Alteromonas sp. 1_MG-2023 TaxID=3062669 RepID=UPI0026E2C667|nr:O-antigen ligase family protein [Alteromonas sp. 1_MG-2023]MDO6567489.1 O-antigen ligase family protein [Alteromonas sp. 1_MG-2023]
MLSVNNRKTEKFLFGFLLFTLFWLPIPLGANRPWAWALMQVSVFAISALLVVFHFRSVTLAVRQYRYFLLLWFLFLAWQLLNLVPLPASLIGTLRPEKLLPEFVSLPNGISRIASPKWLALSFDVGQSQIVFMKSLCYCLLFFSVLAMVRSTSRLKLVLIAISASGIFQAIYGSLEVLSGMEYSLVFQQPVTHIATGSFIYKNHFANYLLLTLSAALGYLIASLGEDDGMSKRERMRRWLKFWLGNKVLFRIGIIIMVIALVMSRSRMGNTAFFVSMTVTAALGLWYFKPRQKSYIALFVSMLVIDIMIVSSVFGLNEVKQRLEQTDLAQESRDEVITDALPLLADHPLIGTGGGTFYTVYPQFQSDSIQHFYDHAHNEYLQFSIEFGLVGSLFMGIFVLLCGINAFKAFKERRHPLPRGAAFACFMAIIGMAMHISVDFPLQAPANTAIFITLLALGVMSNRIRVRKPAIHS